MLLDIITRLSEDTGFHLVQDRNALVKLANRSLLDIYNILECNKIYREVTLVVGRNKVVTLPSFIGELRGTKMHTNELPFDLMSIGQPRYTDTTWHTNYKNWRDLGEVPVHTLAGVVGPITLETTNVADNASVLIIGQTNKADRDEETVVLDSASKPTVKLFGPRLDKIVCFTDRISDIVVKDADGTELAVLYNDDKNTRYKLIDVSQVFWSVDTLNDESLIDIAYKVKLTYLTKDSDSFPAGEEYDNAWYHWAMHLYLKPLDNRAEDSMTERASALAALSITKDTSEQEIIKKLNFGRNKYFNPYHGYFYDSWPWMQRG